MQPYPEASFFRASTRGRSTDWTVGITVIKINRPKLSSIERLVVWSQRAAKETQRLESQLRAGRVRDYRPLWSDPVVKEVLINVFHGKCAYCESSVVASSFANIDHFRPKSSVLENPSFPGYWWLSYEWENIYLCCQLCNGMRGNRFPILGERASPFDTGNALLKENALLLDPCLDDPEEHLAFHENGIVAEKSHRGQTTIQIHGLNRASLVDERRRAMEETTFRVELAALENRQAGEITRLLVDPGLPYMAARRAALNRKIIALRDAFGATVEGRKLVTQAKKAQPLTHEQVERLIQQSEAEQEKSAQYSVESDEVTQSQTYRAVQRRIERIEIRNFRCIENISLRFPDCQTDHEAWLMLLGENAMGKSSVLQAVALALMGQEHANKLELDAQSFVRHNAEEARGWVEIKLSNLKPIRMDFRHGDTKFEITPPDPKVLLLGYGATRLLPRHGLSGADTNKYIRIKNLFDPTAPLNDADKWLSDTEKLPEQKFKEIAGAIKDALLLPESVEATREKGSVEFILAHDRISLIELSDGYQSVTAMVADIAFCVLEKWPSIKDAEAVVLLDEIEVHLHPRWKMTIVDRLRQSFPRLSFIVTTHDPLCLRGLHKGEVLVLRRDAEGKVSCFTEIPDLDEYRADQLLTSPLFDLATTRGPQTETIRERYGQLLEKERRTKAEELEFRMLEERLGGLEIDERVPAKGLDILDQSAVESITSGITEEVRKRLLALVSSRGNNE